MAKQVKGVHVTVCKELAERLTFLRNFKHRLPNLNADLERSVLETVATLELKVGVSEDSWRRSRRCPKCSAGVLLIKKSKKANSTPFFGCSKYPSCTHTEQVKNSPRSTKDRK